MLKKVYAVEQIQFMCEILMNSYRIKRYMLIGTYTLYYVYFAFYMLFLVCRVEIMECEVQKAHVAV